MTAEMSVSREDLRRFVDGHRTAEQALRAERRRRLRNLSVEQSRAEYDALVRLWEASPRDGDLAALDRRAIRHRVELRRKLGWRR